MDILKKQLRPGIRALIEVARVDSNLSPADITFKLAPRINAAGRLGNAITALELLNAETSSTHTDTPTCWRVSTRNARLRNRKYSSRQSTR
jgi:single-stranded DNA-specific DHH superfamily exonuclease